MKHMAIIVTVILALLGGAVGVGQVQQKAISNEKQVDEVKHKVEKQDEQIDDLEDFSIKQTILMDRHIQILEKLEERVK